MTATTILFIICLWATGSYIIYRLLPKSAIDQIIERNINQDPDKGETELDQRITEEAHDAVVKFIRASVIVLSWVSFGIIVISVVCDLVNSKETR